MGHSVCVCVCARARARARVPIKLIFNILNNHFLINIIYYYILYAIKEIKNCIKNFLLKSTFLSVVLDVMFSPALA